MVRGREREFFLMVIGKGKREDASLSLIVIGKRKREGAFLMVRGRESCSLLK